MKLVKVALFACAVALSLPSVASAAVISGTTTTGPVFTRPTVSLVSLSSAGTGVHYQVTEFSVSSAGSYNFSETALPVYDTFLILYSNSFDPAHPLANALIANDDIMTGIEVTPGLSQFSSNLLTGVSYFVVATGFAPEHFGAYTLTIDGPGTITLGSGSGAVPEPAAWMLMIGGFGLVGGAMRRRQKVAVTFQRVIA